MSRNQTASTSNAASTFSMLNENAVMNIQRPKEMYSSQKYFNRHFVRAGELLARDCSTEVVDVSKLSQTSTSIIHYVKIGSVRGLLYCINDLMSTACWIKAVSFANDCHSYNVLLTFATNGIIIKTIRNISLGEDLLMWFDDNILTKLDMSFLRPFNIQGYNRYVCHICNKCFEFPNPLKVHIALKCDQLGINYLWAGLENELNLMMRLRNIQSVTVPANGYSCTMEIEKIIDNLEKSRQGYTCFYCGKVYTSRHTLKIHTRTHTGFRPFKCLYCYQTFGKHSNWTKHIRSHLGGIGYM